MNEALQKRESFWFLFFITLMLLVSCIPYVSGIMRSTENVRFMGIVHNLDDQVGYLALMRQAHEGKMLFTNLYTAEHFEALIFNPFFILMGFLSRIFDPVLVYHGARIVFGFSSLWLIYLLVRRVTSDQRERWLAFILSTMAGGIFWIIWMVRNLPEFGAKQSLLNFFSHSTSVFMELMSAEAYTFFSLWCMPHLLVALTLQLGVSLIYIRYLETGKSVFLIASALLCNLLGTVHYYNVVTLYIVLFFYNVFLVLTKRLALKKAAGDLLTFALISIPPLIYGMWIVLSHPEYLAWMPRLKTPPFHQLLAAYGILSIFAFWYLFRFVRSRMWQNADWTTLFIVAWLIGQIAALYLPFRQQHRFIQGFQIPLGIMAGIALSRYLMAAVIPKSRFAAYAMAGFLVTVALFPGFLRMGISINSLDPHTTNAFLHVDEIRAMDWLEKQRPQGVVLASREHGLWLPAIAGCRVYQGHWCLTLYSQEKYLEYLSFIQSINEGKEEQARQFLGKWHLSHIFLLRAQVSGAAADRIGLKEIYGNEKIVIYETLRTDQ
ncbi:MAG: hypothetical protein RDV48_18770 [Candidatus Eremiobacteraeota bacterium]|nr:hypothetical protein [Candidatus Eremiobacteraeota bacterium]